MDNLTKEQRHKNMQNIHSSNTKPELKVRRLLRDLKIKYRCNNYNLPGKPDFTLYGREIAIFVHGCFWHRHNGCKGASVPASNVRFWKNKLISNVIRDRSKARQLRCLGYKVITIWECETKRAKMIPKLFKKLSLLA